MATFLMAKENLGKTQIPTLDSNFGITEENG